MLTQKAVRSLRKHEKVPKGQVMRMRWVLTWKTEGVAKARLVVLGFQAHNLTQVQTAAPTLSKLGRNMLLSMAALRKFKLESAYVSPAFLQAAESMEDKELYNEPPPEVAAAFGLDPKDKGDILKITKAFYGLAHAPRAWWLDVVETLKKHG